MTTTRRPSSTALGIIEDVAAANAASRKPSKADLCRGLPSKTRAGRYIQIDRLLGGGLLSSADSTGASYALTVTDAGRAAIA